MTQPHLRGGARYGTAGRDIVREFNDYFGNQSKLENWQMLCDDLELHGDFTSINKCKKGLSKVWVNIWDLLDAVQDDSLPPTKYSSKKALQVYTSKYKRYFPLHRAKEGGPVRMLLIKM